MLRHYESQFNKQAIQHYVNPSAALFFVLCVVYTMGIKEPVIRSLGLSVHPAASSRYRKRILMTFRVNLHQ